MDCDGAARWVALTLLTAAPASAQDPACFTAGTDVVVLNGLAGDAETEKAYEDQLRPLLEALASPSCRPARVFVLTDVAATLPTALTGEVREATRREVTALAARLRSADTPRVLVAWGHGGTLSGAPVFHVRGPRITPDDFASLGGRATRGVLFFRGSGRFARALASPGRAILASEDGVTFRSDPIGLSLWLQAFHADPSAPFDTLAARTGSAVRGWYDEHRLARQEEPTLSMGEKTTRLAEARGDASPPAAPASAASGAWAGVVPVDPSRHPEDDAVVLRETTSVVLGDAPAIRIETDQFVQVLTAEGVAHGDLDLTYSPPDEDLVLEDAEVRHADGRIERVAPDKARELGPTDVDGYLRPRQRRLAFPGLAPGAIFRLHLVREWRRFPLPSTFLELPLAQELPVEHASVEVRVPLRGPFHWAFRNASMVEPTVASTREARVYRWQMNDVPATPREPLAPRSSQPTLLVSTFANWAAFSAWYRGLIQDADTVTPEIASRASEVTRGSRTQREKVAALYAEVARMRYVAVPLGVNSHRPHAAANVLHNRFGDCKDKANLFNTLLRAVGIPADLVLVPRFTQADEAVPGLAFNHAISRVHLADGDLWVDTTDDVARFGLLPPGDPGRKVLVVGSDSLATLPVPRASDHRLTLDMRFRQQEGGLEARLDAEATGFADYALRMASRGAGPRESVLGRTLRPVEGQFALRQQSHTPAGDLEQAFAWHGEGTMVALDRPVPGTDRRLLSAPFWLPREWDQALDDRRGPLFVGEGYPLELIEQVEFETPVSGTATLPPSLRRDSGPLRWTIAWSSETGRVRARLELFLDTGELDLAGTHAFQAGLRLLYQDLAAGAVVGSP